MAGQILHDSAEVWALAARQHGVVTRAQLLALGFTRAAIEHRLKRGRLHPVWRGVFAVGRQELSREGRWMGAVLSCGPEAVLSHLSAAVAWGVLGDAGGEIHVTVPAGVCRRHPGIVVHRRAGLDDTDVVRRRGIPVTDPASTMIDVAGAVRGDVLEAAINAADRLGLVDPEALRTAAAAAGLRLGAPVLRAALDRRTFVLTDSQLERRFLPIARRAGLARPQTGRWLNGFKVDFFWPKLGLVVETDGLRYHRTPAQQARDRLRDQAHIAAGLLVPALHARPGCAHTPAHVEATLAATRRQLEPEGFDRP